MPKLLIVSTVAITLKSFLLPYARHFRSQGWQVDGMAKGISDSPECVDAFDGIWEVDWSRNPLDPSNFLKAPKKIRKIVEEGGYDIVHVHTPVAAFVTRYALRKLRKEDGGPRVIYTAHGFHFYRGGAKLKNAIFLTLEKIAGGWTDHLIVINREDHEAVEKYRIVSPENLTQMPGIGIDMERYAPGNVREEDVKEVRSEMELNDGERFFLMIAEFNPGKRHRDTLRAFAELKGRNMHLAFAGTGALMAEMQSLAEELAVADRVHFLGFRKDIQALIRASVATILPSEREGLPRSVMESMALETPVIGTSIRGTEDLLADGGGLLVDVGDIKGLANAMDWILEHEDDVLRMGRQGRSIIERYGIEKTIAMHEDVYSKTMESSVG